MSPLLEKMCFQIKRDSRNCEVTENIRLLMHLLSNWHAFQLSIIAVTNCPQTYWLTMITLNYLGQNSAMWTELHGDSSSLLCVTSTGATQIE